jgi:hypothetical protein
MATVFTTEFQLFRRTENSQNSLPNHSAEEKNSVPLNRNRSKLSNVVPKHFEEKKTARNSIPWDKNRNKLLKSCSGAIRGRENSYF